MEGHEIEHLNPILLLDGAQTDLENFFSYQFLQLMHHTTTIGILVLKDRGSTYYY